MVARTVTPGRAAPNGQSGLTNRPFSAQHRVVDAISPDAIRASQIAPKHPITMRAHFSSARCERWLSTSVRKLTFRQPAPKAWSSRSRFVRVFNPMPHRCVPSQVEPISACPRNGPE